MTWCVTCLSLSSLSCLSSIKPFSQQSYAMQASGPGPITGGPFFSPWCVDRALSRQPSRETTQLTTKGSLKARTNSCKHPFFFKATLQRQHFFTCTHTTTLLSRLQVMKPQRGWPCPLVPPLGRVEVLPAPSCGCWSFPLSSSNLRTQRL